MKQMSLATRYRPQLFADVVGQEVVKTMLSRAALKDIVAPAYLLSGTRGVGKTTLARIFAKALNCEHAPIADPCNACSQCQSITQGAHVDVVEIDGASNRGIDDARKLRENIAFVPMSGRYKIVIIDEAHMLTREAFNALLKTLEEPPKHVTFIFATTEPHKVPITIVSRCQHYLLKCVDEKTLAGHLIDILNKEAVLYEAAAIQIIAKRAAGSVRDSISLLGQTLMLGEDHVTESVVRRTLGLVEQSFYSQLLTACGAQDYIAVVRLTRTLLEQGVDIGFFLKEFSIVLRNIFLLQQAKDIDTEELGVTLEEEQQLRVLAERLEHTYVHAAWQMVLESQRNILSSLEPSVALELLLLNLASLHNIVSLEQFSRVVLSAQRNGLKKNINQPIGSSVEKDFSQQECKDSIPKNVQTLEPKAVVIEDEASLSQELDEQRVKGSMVSWQGFLEYCTKEKKTSMHFLVSSEGAFQKNTLEIQTRSFVQYEIVCKEKRVLLQDFLREYAGKEYTLKILQPEDKVEHVSELKREASAHPIIQELQKTFDAELVQCTMDPQEEVEKALV